MNQTSSKATEEEEEGGGGRERRMNAAIESQHSQFHESQQNDDFLEQMLSTIPSCSWPPNSHELSPPNVNPNTDRNAIDPDLKSLLQLQLLGLPLSLGDPDSVDASAFISQAAAEASVQALYNGLAGSLHANAQSADQQHFHSPPPPSQGVSLGGGLKGGMNQAPPVSASTGGSSGAGAPQRQRVRARRGQATDPHSIAERLRRERIAERMKALQELVPNANKTDKASMLDEIIDYVKFLQLQVKVLSMSRLGGGAPAAPMVAGMNSEGVVGQSGDEGTQTAPTSDGMTVAEHQVAKLMEEDMGSAMQYLQGKGLCLMPISLATAISTTTSLAHTQSRSHIDYNGNRHDVNGNQHHHSLLSSAPSSNGAGDHPTPNSSIKDPSNS